MAFSSSGLFIESRPRKVGNVTGPLMHTDMPCWLYGKHFGVFINAPTISYLYGCSKSME